jgi:sterol desaturase/sphingolipid hydroxylase (fatty acid hydroxylase superfamily)
MAGTFAAAAAVAGGAPLGAGAAAAVTVGNTFAVAALERVLPRRPGHDLLRDPQSLRDVGHGVLFSFVGRPVASAAALGTVALLARVVPGVGAPWPRAAPLVAQMALALALWGLGSYAFHRSLHTFTPLWGFHAIHHDTRQMHLLKSGRVHVGEEVLQFLLVPLPLLLLGCPGDVLLWVGLWTVAEGNLAHSNLAQRFLPWMHYAIATVQLHNVHHAEPRAWQDSNYAAITPLFDVLFGTFRHPDRHPVDAMGIAGDPVPREFVGQLLHPFRALRGGAT